MQTPIAASGRRRLRRGQGWAHEMTATSMDEEWEQLTEMPTDTEQMWAHMVRHTLALEMEGQQTVVALAREVSQADLAKQSSSPSHAA